ncbi:Hypothetical protein, putative [Bodo saltans]|uniref:Uncharacterized protein n=1 Tax=Bodo saltans TaxID=75058 RepID=A0A0S4IHQ4_BODSA|nr:Hypothetical protein, putative [Bodo saltans]|eukprot:CUE67709.1 Hypothetical protein, putative [Bodo saltans]
MVLNAKDANHSFIHSKNPVLLLLQNPQQQDMRRVARPSRTTTAVWHHVALHVTGTSLVCAFNGIPWHCEPLKSMFRSTRVLRAPTGSHLPTRECTTPTPATSTNTDEAQQPPLRSEKNVTTKPTMQDLNAKLQAMKAEHQSMNDNMSALRGRQTWLQEELDFMDESQKMFATGMELLRGEHYLTDEEYNEVKDGLDDVSRDIQRTEKRSYALWDKIQKLEKKIIRSSQNYKKTDAV